MKYQILKRFLNNKVFFKYFFLYSYLSHLNAFMMLRILVLLRILEFQIIQKTKILFFLMLHKLGLL